MASKQCACGSFGPFGKKKRGDKIGVRDVCKACHCRKSQAWRLANPDKVQKHNRWWAEERRRRTGVPCVDVDACLSRQGGACAICRVPFGRGTKGPHVDHDHATGAFRGLLCHQCNRGLGMFKDNVEVLTAAAHYLRGIPSPVESHAEHDRRHGPGVDAKAAATDCNLAAGGVRVGLESATAI